MKKSLFPIFIIPLFALGVYFWSIKTSQQGSSPKSATSKPIEYSKNTWLGSYAIQHPEYKTMPIKAMSEYSVSFQRADGKTETDITGAPMNYKDENGQWKPIDPTLKQVGSFFTGDGIKTKIGIDGTVEVDPDLIGAGGQNFSQKTTRFGYFNPVTQTFTPLETFGQGQIEDNIFTQKGTWYKNQITVFDNGLKEELILDRAPDLSRHPELVYTERSARVSGSQNNSYLMFETQIQGIDVPDGWVDGELTAGKLHFPLPTAFDANKKEADTKRFAKKINGEQYIFTGVPVSWLATASYPVTIDPDYAADTADGTIYGSNATYATARSTSTSVDMADPIWVGQYDGNYIYRGFFKFSTDSIPDTDTITQANAKFTPTVDDSATDFDVQIAKFTWTETLLANREADYDGCLAATQDAIWRNTAGISINTQYTSGNLDTTWINKTGATYYCLISSRDHDGSGVDPTGNEGIGIASQNNGTAGYRPVLTVVHAPAPTATPTPTPTPATYPVNLNRGVNIKRGTTIKRN